MKDETAMFVINKNSTIHDAMVLITENKRGSVAVVDDNSVFLGVVSDGEIRRAIVKGAVDITPLAKIINANAIYIYETEDIERKALEIFEKDAAINIVPVVDKNNVLKDVIVRK